MMVSRNSTKLRKYIIVVNHKTLRLILFVMNYCFSKYQSHKIEDNYVVFKADFESDSNLISGEFRIGITKHNDFVLRLDPWKKTTDVFKPVDYELKEINEDNITKDNSRLKFKISDIEFKLEFNNSRLMLKKNNQTVEIILGSNKDLKGNICNNGTGYKTKKFNNNPEKIERTVLNIKKSDNEEIYGGGERFKSIDHSGSELDIEVTQGAGTRRDKTYKSSPRFISSQNYGYIINTYSSISCDFGSKSCEVIENKCNEQSSEYIFCIEDNIKDCLTSFYNYDPINENPPMWSYGFWSSRNSYKSWDQVIDIAKEYRDRNVPCDVIHIDPSWIEWSGDYNFEWSKSFSNPRENIQKLHNMGFKVSIWVYPYVPLNSPMYKDAKESYFIKNSTGGVFIFNDDNKKLAIVDFTNSDAFDWWSNSLSEIISDGVDIIKADFGEYIDNRTIFSNQRTGSEMRNAYPEIYQKACVSAFKKAEKKPLLWSRSGWLSQNPDSIHWNGDAESDWSGYRTTIKSGLNASMSSYNFWSSDVGGYRNNPSDKLYGEWLKYSSFGSSHVRAHGKSPREPWEFNESFDDSKRILSERYNFIPYIYSYGQIAQEKGIPVVRPMVLEDDERASNYKNTQFMLGDHILVSPYTTKNRDCKTYLPDDSNWISYFNKVEHSGGKIVGDTYNQTLIPIYIRKGSCIPFISNNVNTLSSDYSVVLKKYGDPSKKINTPYYDETTMYNVNTEPDGSLYIDNEVVDIHNIFEDIVHLRLSD